MPCLTGCLPGGRASRASQTTRIKEFAKQKGSRRTLICLPDLHLAKLGMCLVAATATATAITTATATTGAATATTSAATVTAATGAAATGTTAVATAAAATTEAAAARAGRTGFHRTGFVHHEATATELLAIHGIDGGLCLRIIAHFDETETFRAAGVTFHHDFGAGNGTVCCERLLQIFVTERIRQVAYVKFVAHERTPQNNSKRDGVHNRNQQTIKDLKQTRD
jgi:hypothetical protein